MRPMIRSCAWIWILLLGVGSAAEREPWTTSRVKGSPEPAKPYAVQRVYPHLQFDQPVELVPLPGTNQMLLLEVGGKVYTFDDNQDCSEAHLAFDLRSRIDQFRRAYTLCPHPRFEENREIFICYAGDPVARPDGTRLSRFKMTATQPPKIDPDSEEVLLTWASGGHNGCAIRFDAEGLLYFSAGDGARPYPPDEYDVSQDLSDLRSTLCRINVDRRDGDRGYSIPEDNPFVDLPGARPEIWAYGFRNPWRFSIDPKTQSVLCGDVGWELWELIFHVQRGGNYGWSLYEGPQPIRNDITPGPTPIRKPLVAYPHSDGLSVTGGFTYYGAELPELEGAYLYGDYVTGLLWGLRFEDEKPVWNEVLTETGLKIITFCEARDHEVLVVSFDGGIYRLIRNVEVDRPSEFPRQLSETGLFTSTETLQLSPGVYPYRIAVQAWQSGADSEFAVGVPGTETIQIHKQRRNWKYPKNTVFAKTLSKQVMHRGQLEKRRIETQLIHFDGLTWQPYSYAWNDAQDDAELVPAQGFTREFEVLDEAGRKTSLPWRFHNRSECRACHSNQTGGAVGFSFSNLSQLGSPPDEESQIDAFVQREILNTHAPSQWELRPMIAPGDTSQPLEARARSYLAANCAHCHCRGGGGTVALDLTYSNPTDQISAVDFPATQGLFELGQARVIVPGDPYRSVLFYRMATSGKGHMPKLWTRDNDTAGLQLVHDWIVSLADSATSPEEVPVASGQDDTATALRQFHQLLTARSDLQPALVADALENANAVTIGLFERFLSVDQRTERLGHDIDVSSILAIRGDAASGRRRFLTSKVQQCRNCHRVDGEGQSIGPDLDGIGKKRSKAELLESLIDPARKIEPEFVSHTIVTLDDEVLTGLKLSQNAAHVVLRSADGKTHTIAREDIEYMTSQAKSLMPDGLAAEMTAQELADLLAFLSSLR